MLNLYSCGCSATDVPVLSRCKEHNGYVVIVSNNEVPARHRTSFRTKNRKLSLLYCSLLDGMRRLRESTVGLIFTYPDHYPFLARDRIDSNNWRDFPDKYFPECKRVLQPDGHVVLIIEHLALASVVYSAIKAGFKIVSQSVVRMVISDEPVDSTFLNDFYVYKVCLVLTHRAHDSNKSIGDIQLKNVGRHIANFHTGGLVLDTSCIHYPVVIAAHKVTRTVGIVSDWKRYNALKERIKKESSNGKEKVSQKG